MEEVSHDGAGGDDASKKNSFDDLDGIPGLEHATDQSADAPGEIREVGTLNFGFPTETPAEAPPADFGAGSSSAGGVGTPIELGSGGGVGASLELNSDGGVVAPLELSSGSDAGASSEFNSASGAETPLELDATNDEPPSLDLNSASEAEAPHSDPLAPTREYAEKISNGSESVPAAFPFSVLIEGALTAEEKEKLLTVLSRENMGISEVDIEPQLEAGRVLIPRISEYAGILIVQALRAAQASLRLGPSDSIFATDDTRNTLDETAAPLLETVVQNRVLAHEAAHAAERIPLVSSSHLPGHAAAALDVIDTLVVSAALRSHVVEAQKSSEYHEMLEALTRELRYRAYRKGAQAIVNFNVQLDSLGTPGRFRLTVSGTAARSS
jgi:hypothetical protein